MKHSERVALHGGRKRRRKVCTAPAGSRGECRVSVALEVSGNGEGGAGVCPGEVQSNCVRWRDLKRLWGGKGGLERQQLAIQLRLG